MARKNTSNKIGATFEGKLTKIFEKYRKEQKAYIVKVPTEFVILRRGQKIVSAFPKKQSPCLDYIGVLKSGKFITFEAKSYDAIGKKQPKPFPLSNIRPYQFDLNKEIYNYTDNIFYIIEARLEDRNDTFLLHARDLQSFVDNNERKSIPYETLKKIAIQMDDLDILKYLN